MPLRRHLLTAAVALIAALPALAHHSFAAEFDDRKPIKVSGTVTKVDWQNPHIWFHVDVKGEDGKVTNWAFSGGAPGQLMRRGIKKASIQPGMTIMVEGFMAKDGTHNASGGRVTFPDGSQVFTAGSEDRLPGQGRPEVKQ
jgi:lipopolysaccharide export system protein LptA